MTAKYDYSDSSTNMVMDVGKKCCFEKCGIIDFLPFYCKDCCKYYCSEHKQFNHKCVEQRDDKQLQKQKDELKPKKINNITHIKCFDCNCKTYIKNDHVSLMIAQCKMCKNHFCPNCRIVHNNCKNIKHINTYATDLAAQNFTTITNRNMIKKIQSFGIFNESIEVKPNKKDLITPINKEPLTDSINSIPTTSKDLTNLEESKDLTKSVINLPKNDLPKNDLPNDSWFSQLGWPIITISIGIIIPIVLYNYYGKNRILNWYIKF
jgi:hypothetical protein